jgi:hypothetical protein
MPICPSRKSTFFMGSFTFPFSYRSLTGPCRFPSKFLQRLTTCLSFVLQPIGVMVTPECCLSSFTLGNPLLLKCSCKNYFTYLYNCNITSNMGYFHVLKMLTGPIVRNCTLPLHFHFQFLTIVSSLFSLFTSPPTYLYLYPLSFAHNFNTHTHAHTHARTHVWHTHTHTHTHTHRFPTSSTMPTPRGDLYVHSRID